MATKTRADDAPEDSKAPSAPAAPPSPRTGRAAIEVKALRAVMKDMGAVVEKRNTVPVLACVLIAVGPSTMTLTATDLDLQLVRQLDLAEAGSGVAFTLAVDAGVLRDICNKLPGDEMMLLEHAPAAGGTGGQLRISCGPTRYVLHALPPDDFPILRPDGDGGDARFEMPRGSLQQLLEAVAFAQSTEPTRYYLNGIFLHGEESPEGEADLLVAAATDGHRLAVMRVEAPEGALGLNGLGGKPGVILGSKAVRILCALLDNEGGVPTIDCSFSARTLVAEIGTTTLTAKLIDGTFPVYTRVIPTVHNVNAWVDPKGLATIVERVTTLATDKTRSVRLDLERASIIRASVTSPEAGTAQDEIEAQLDGPGAAPGLTVGFNSTYLCQVLAHLTASPALLRFSDSAGAVLIMDAEDSRRQFVLMPMRV